VALRTAFYFRTPFKKLWLIKMSRANCLFSLCFWELQVLAYWSKKAYT